MDSTGITPVMNMGNDGGFGLNGIGGIFALLILLGFLTEASAVWAETSSTLHATRCRTASTTRTRRCWRTAS